MRPTNHMFHHSLYRPNVPHIQLHIEPEYRTLFHLQQNNPRSVQFGTAIQARRNAHGQPDLHKLWWTSSTWPWTWDGNSAFHLKQVAHPIPQTCSVYHSTSKSSALLSDTVGVTCSMMHLQGMDWKFTQNCLGEKINVSAKLHEWTNHHFGSFGWSVPFIIGAPSIVGKPPWEWDAIRRHLAISKAPLVCQVNLNDWIQSPLCHFSPHHQFAPFPQLTSSLSKITINEHFLCRHGLNSNTPWKWREDAIN